MNYVVDVITRASDWFGQWFVSAVPVQATNDEYASYLEPVDVQWMGGPLDGLTKAIDPAEVWQLPPLVEMACPVGTSLKAQQLGAKRIAVYVLDFDGPRWFYRFHGMQPMTANVSVGNRR